MVDYALGIGLLIYPLILFCRGFISPSNQQANTLESPQDDETTPSINVEEAIIAATRWLESQEYAKPIKCTVAPPSVTSGPHGEPIKRSLDKEDLRSML